MITVIYLPLPLLTKEGKEYQNHPLETRRPDFFCPQVGVVLLSVRPAAVARLAALTTGYCRGE